jgi:hypothetical protein
MRRIVTDLIRTDLLHPLNPSPINRPILCASI